MECKIHLLELNTLFNIQSYKLNFNYASLLHWVECYWSSRQRHQIWPKANCQSSLNSSRKLLSYAEPPLSFGWHPMSLYPMSFWLRSLIFDHYPLAFVQRPLTLGALSHPCTVEIWPLVSGCSEDCLGWQAPCWKGWLRGLQENRLFGSWVFWSGPCTDKVRRNQHLGLREYPYRKYFIKDM